MLCFVGDKAGLREELVMPLRPCRIGDRARGLFRLPTCPLLPWGAAQGAALPSLFPPDPPRDDLTPE